MTLYLYESRKGPLGHFDRHSYNPLEFELCTYEELPDEQKNLGLLSAVYIGELSAGELIVRFSRYGEEAYHEFC